MKSKKEVENKEVEDFAHELTAKLNNETEKEPEHKIHESIFKFKKNKKSLMSHS